MHSEVDSDVHPNWPISVYQHMVCVAQELETGSVGVAQEQETDPVGAA